AVERVSDSVLRGAEATLSRICLPAAEELGLLFKDKVSAWRQWNLIATLKKAESMLGAASSDAHHAPPRLVMGIVDRASWSETEEVQQMWAGLLVSSCTPDGGDESNWIFINLLGQLTAMQAHILNWACETAQKKLQPDGLIAAEGLYRSGDELT